MPFIQLTQAKPKISQLSLTPSYEEGGRILLSIEPKDVKSIVDLGDIRLITFIYSEHNVQSEEMNIATGRLTQLVVMEDYDYLVSVIGIKGIIGS
jgi:hypothetical protein